jgi:hypothetical protein
VTVTVNGALSMANLTSITNFTMTIASAANVALDALSMMSRGGGSTNSVLAINNTASLSVPVLATVEDVNMTLNTTGGVTAPGLTAYTSTNTSTFLQLSNAAATFTAAALSSITNLIVRVRSGASLTLPGVTSYTYNLNASTSALDVSGSGSLLSLPNLVSLTFNTGNAANRTLTILSGAAGQAGSTLNVSSLSSVSLGTNDFMTVTANGAGSTVDLSALTPLPAGVTLNPLSGGTISN